jgi:predicted RecB family nuclease
MITKITREVLESHLSCKYKSHLKLDDHQGSITDYEEMLLAERREVRQKVLGKILTPHSELVVAREIVLTAATLRAGPSLVLDAILEDDVLALAFDGLKRIDEPSSLGDFHYIPLLFYEGGKVGKRQKLLLEILGLLLSQIQGRLPAYGVVWHGRECKLARVRLSQHLRRAERLLREVKEIAGRSSKPRLILNDHCPVCEFSQRCHAQAEQEDNISLLRGMGEREVARYTSGLRPKNWSSRNESLRLT